MKHHTIRILTLGLAIAMTFLAGCSALPLSITIPGLLSHQQIAPHSMSANEILTQSQEAMVNLSSFAYAIQTRLNSGILRVTANGQGVYQAPDKMYMTLNALGQEFQILIDGSSGILIKLPGSSAWTQLTPDVAAQMGGNLDIRSQIKVAEYASSPTVVGEETIDGVECYVIQYNIDVNKLFELNPAISSLLDPVSTNGDGKAWIGKGDFYLRKLLFEGTTNVQESQVSTRTVLKFHSFNQPVVIPSP
jgi:outer membrane lipoprotein-sorting protein